MIGPSRRVCTLVHVCDWCAFWCVSLTTPGAPLWLPVRNPSPFGPRPIHAGPSFLAASPKLHTDYCHRIQTQSSGGSSLARCGNCHETASSLFRAVPSTHQQTGGLLTLLHVQLHPSIGAREGSGASIQPYPYRLIWVYKGVRLRLPASCSCSVNFSHEAFRPTQLVPLRAPVRTWGGSRMPAQVHVQTLL